MKFSKGRVGLVSVIALGAALLPMASGANAASTAAYDAIGASPPPNVPSIGFEATSTSEFGDRVELAPGTNTLRGVTVMMSSWGCEDGGWNTNDCATTPGATFSHPLTITLYEVDDSVSPAVPGAVVATQTKSFEIPYRPSASASCSGGRWDAGGGDCFSGLATPVTFDFAGDTALPSEVIWGMSYNTTSHGANPIGTSAPCRIQPGGCGYDSLNVGVESLAGQPSAGVDVDEDVAYADSTWSAFYADGGAGGLGTFRADTGWTGYRPLARIDVSASFGFEGFGAPINNNQVNIAKAGQTIPVKWRLTDGGVAVSDPASFVSLTSRQVNCATNAGEGTDAIESYTNSSGLLYQSDGNWQFNWKTPKAYAGQCRVMTVTLSDGTTHTASFQFK